METGKPRGERASAYPMKARSITRSQTRVGTHLTTPSTSSLTPCRVEEGRTQWFTAPPPAEPRVVPPQGQHQLTSVPAPILARVLRVTKPQETSSGMRGSIQTPPISRV